MTTAAGADSYILFSVAGTTYALRSGYVRHMEMVEHVTPVPNVPGFVDGIVSSRGQIVPVINLRARFGFERVAADMRTRLIVVDIGARVVGLLADSAREFITIRPDAIQPPGQAIGGLSSQYLEGIATLGDRLVLILSAAELLSTTETTAIATA